MRVLATIALSGLSSLPVTASLTPSDADLASRLLLEDVQDARKAYLDPANEPTNTVNDLGGENLTSKLKL